MPCPTPSARCLPTLFRALAGWRGGGCTQVFAAWLLALVLSPALAAPTVTLEQARGATIGRLAEWLVEDGTELSLEQARDAAGRGRFRDLGQGTPAFGLQSPPVWMHLRLRNDASLPKTGRLVIRAAWLDQIDAYVLHEGRLASRWQGGDTLPGAEGLEPGLGVVAPVPLAPGETELYVRFRTSDAMLLPLYLVDDTALQRASRIAHYVFGLTYGFVLALLVYNATVGLALREPSYLMYATYVLATLSLNLVANGFGQAWWWTEAPALQAHAIPLMLAAKGLCGLLFTSTLFQFARYAPRVRTALWGACLLGLGAVVAALLLQAVPAANTLSRNYMVTATLGMLVLGIWQMRRSVSAAPLFVLGVAAGLAGTLVTLLTIRGQIEMTPLRYHAVGLGYVVEGLLLALALVSRMRQSRNAHRQAEHLAMRDALTGLLNRRGFLESSRQAWDDPESRESPLSLLMLDIDHFKSINDTHGHDAGDQVLVAVAQLLAHHCREGDEVGRWGGEEFVVLLRGATLQQAGTLADRLRLAIAGLSIPVQGKALGVTVSLGAVQRTQQGGLYELVSEADLQLYAAKRGGRNRVAMALSPV